MSNNSMESPITADIGDGRHIIFISKQDALLFIANFSTLQLFEQTVQKLYGSTEGVSALYNYYRMERWREEITSMLRTTLLDDGTILLDAIKERIQPNG